MHGWLTLVRSSQSHYMYMNADTICDMVQKTWDIIIWCYPETIINNIYCLCHFYQAPAYEGLSQVIKTGCRAAIWLSERI